MNDTFKRVLLAVSLATIVGWLSWLSIRDINRGEDQETDRTQDQVLLRLSSLEDVVAELAKEFRDMPQRIDAIVLQRLDQLDGALKDLQQQMIEIQPASYDMGDRWRKSEHDQYAPAVQYQIEGGDMRLHDRILRIEKYFPPESYRLFDVVNKPLERE